MTCDVLIRNGKVVTPSGIYEADIAIQNGRIQAISRSDHLTSNSVIDASGKYVLPGIIDPHVHLWSEGSGRTFEQNCVTETKSMLCGGVTSILSYIRGSPSYMDVLPQFVEAVKKESMVDMGFSIVVNNAQQAKEIPRYAKEYGITSFKFYMAPRGKQLFPGAFGADDGVLYETFEVIKKLGYPCIACVHAENWDIVATETEKLRKENPMGDQVVYSQSRPNVNEEEAMRRAIFIASRRDCPLYLVHVSIGEGPSVIAQARAGNLKVFGETCPHFLALTKHDKHAEVPLIHAPPLRDREDVEKLWNGIRDGYISCIGSDHLTGLLKSTIFPEERGNIWTALGGFPESGTILPVMLSEGVSRGRIRLEKVVELCSCNPSRIFGLYPRKGVVQVGSDADLVIVDMKREVTMRPELLQLSSDYSWYDGRRFKGWPILTISRGEIVVQDGQVFSPKEKARYLRRETAMSNPESAQDPALNL